MDTSGPTIQRLSTRDTRWLVDQVGSVLRELGRSWTVVDDVAFQLTDGPLLGLDNLARRLHLAPRRSWERLVREQITTLVRSVSGPPEIPVSALLPKLVDPATVTQLDYDPLEPLPGLPALLSAQMDGYTVAMYTLDLVDDRDEAYATALTNLAALRRPQHRRRRLDHRVRESWVEHLVADDSYGASRVMLLPDLMRTLLGREFPASGVLVAVPTKFDLWVHVPVDETVVETAALLAYEALAASSTQPFAISPDVFLVTPDMHAEVLVQPDREGAWVGTDTLDRLLAGLPRSGTGEAA